MPRHSPPPNLGAKMSGSRAISRLISAADPGIGPETGARVRAICASTVELVPQGMFEFVGTACDAGGGPTGPPPRPALPWGAVSGLSRWPVPAMPRTRRWPHPHGPSHPRIPAGGIAHLPAPGSGWRPDGVRRAGGRLGRTPGGRGSASPSRRGRADSPGRHGPRPAAAGRCTEVARGHLREGPHSTGDQPELWITLPAQRGVQFEAAAVQAPARRERTSVIVRRVGRLMPRGRSSSRYASLSVAGATGVGEMANSSHASAYPGWCVTATVEYCCARVQAHVMLDRAHGRERSRSRRRRSPRSRGTSTDRYSRR